MKSDLIIGLMMCILAIIVGLLLPVPASSIEKTPKKIGYSFLKIIPFIFFCLGYLHLGEFLLDIPGEEINLKNGTFLFFAIYALGEQSSSFLWKLKSFFLKRRASQHPKNEE